MVGDDTHNLSLEKLEDGKKVRVVPSSTRREEYFRELKHLVFKKEKLIRIDKYLVIHLRSLNGTNNLLNRPTKTVQTVERKIAHSIPRAAAKVVKKSGLSFGNLERPSNLDDKHDDNGAITNREDTSADIDDPI